MHFLSALVLIPKCPLFISVMFSQTRMQKAITNSLMEIDYSRWWKTIKLVY